MTDKIILNAQFAKEYAKRKILWKSSKLVNKIERDEALMDLADALGLSVDFKSVRDMVRRCYHFQKAYKQKILNLMSSCVDHGEPINNALIISKAPKWMYEVDKELQVLPALLKDIYYHTQLTKSTKPQIYPGPSSSQTSTSSVKFRVVPAHEELMLKSTEAKLQEMRKRAKITSANEDPAMKPSDSKEMAKKKRPSKSTVLYHDIRTISEMITSGKAILKLPLIPVSFPPENSPGSGQSNDSLSEAIQNRSMVENITREVSAKGLSMSEFIRAVVVKAHRMQAAFGQSILKSIARKMNASTQMLCDIWVRLSAITMWKLRALLNAGDRYKLIDGFAQMTDDDWLIADVLLMYGAPGKLITTTNLASRDLLRPLVTLFHLVQTYKIEELSSQEELRKQWYNLTKKYNEGETMASSVVLQRRWYELKRTAGRRLRARLRAGPRGAAPHPLHTVIARRFPRAVTAPPAPWWHLLNERCIFYFQDTLLTQRKTVCRVPAPTNDKYDSEDDVILVEKQIETIDIWSDNEEEERRLIIDESALQGKENVNGNSGGPHSPLKDTELHKKDIVTQNVAKETYLNRQNIDLLQQSIMISDSIKMSSDSTVENDVMEKSITGSFKNNSNEKNQQIITNVDIAKEIVNSTKQCDHDSSKEIIIDNSKCASSSEKTVEQSNEIQGNVDKEITNTKITAQVIDSNKDENSSIQQTTITNENNAVSTNNESNTLNTNECINNIDMQNASGKDNMNNESTNENNAPLQINKTLAENEAMDVRKEIIEKPNLSQQTPNIDSLETTNTNSITNNDQPLNFNEQSNLNDENSVPDKENTADKDSELIRDNSDVNKDNQESIDGNLTSADKGITESTDNNLTNPELAQLTSTQLESANEDSNMHKQTDESLLLSNQTTPNKDDADINNTVEDTNDKNAPQLEISQLSIVIPTSTTVNCSINGNTQVTSSENAPSTLKQPIMPPNEINTKYGINSENVTDINKSCKCTSNGVLLELLKKPQNTLNKTNKEYFQSVQGNATINNNPCEIVNNVNEIGKESEISETLQILDDLDPDKAQTTLIFDSDSDLSDVESTVANSSQPSAKITGDMIVDEILEKMRPKQLDVLLGNRMRDGPSGNNKSRDKNDASKSSQSSTNGDFVIDEKLLMATEIPLIKIDETQTWKKFARNNSIDLNKIDIDLSVNKSTSELRPMRKVGPVEEMMKYCRPVWVVVSRMSGITGMAGAGRRVQLPDLAALRRRRPPTAHVAPQPHSPPSSHSSQSPRSPHSPRSPFTPHLPKLVDLSESDSDTSFDDTVEYLPSEKQLSDLLKHLTSLGVAESAAAWRRQRPTPPRRTRRHPRLAHVHLNCSCDRCYTSKKHRFVREQHEVQRQLKALLDSLPKSALVETRKPTSETEQDPDYRVKSKKRKKKKQSETTTRTALKPPSHDDYQEWIRQKNIHQRFFQLPSIESQRNKAQKETSHSINARGINNQMQPTHSRSNSNITSANLATNCPTNPLRDILKQRLNERLECKQSEISMMKPNVDRKTIIFDESFRQRMVKSLTDMATKITSQDKSNINDQATNNVASKSIDVDSTDQMVIGQCAETARLNVKKVIEHIVGGQYLGSIIDDGNVVIPSGGKQINRLDVRRVIEQIIGGQSLGRIIDLDNVDTGDRTKVGGQAMDGTNVEQRAQDVDSMIDRVVDEIITDPTGIVNDANVKHNFKIKVSIVNMDSTEDKYFEVPIVNGPDPNGYNGGSTNDVCVDSNSDEPRVCVDETPMSIKITSVFSLADAKTDDKSTKESSKSSDPNITDCNARKRCHSAIGQTGIDENTNKNMYDGESGKRKYKTDFKLTRNTQQSLEVDSGTIGQVRVSQNLGLTILVAQEANNAVSLAARGQTSPNRRQHDSSSSNGSDDSSSVDSTLSDDEENDPTWSQPPSKKKKGPPRVSTHVSPNMCSMEIDNILIPPIPVEKFIQERESELPSLVVLCIDRSKPIWKLLDENLVVTDYVIPILEPTYWSTGPLGKTAMLIFPDSQESTHNQTGQSGNLTSQSNNQMSQIWNQTSQSGNQTSQSGNQTSQSGNQTNQSGNQTSQNGNQTSQSGTGTSKISTNVYTNSDGTTVLLQAPDEVCIDNNVYKKLHNIPLVYGRVKYVISDRSICEILGQKNVPIELYSLRTGKVTPTCRMAGSNIVPSETPVQNVSKLTHNPAVQNSPESAPTKKPAGRQPPALLPLSSFKELEDKQIPGPSPVVCINTKPILAQSNPVTTAMPSTSFLQSSLVTVAPTTNSLFRPPIINQAPIRPTFISINPLERVPVSPFISPVIPSIGQTSFCLASNNTLLPNPVRGNLIEVRYKPAPWLNTRSSLKPSVNNSDVVTTLSTTQTQPRISVKSFAREVNADSPPVVRTFITQHSYLSNSLPSTSLTEK